jgi:hypothetical protein
VDEENLSSKVKKKVKKMDKGKDKLDADGSSQNGKRKYWK